MERERIRFAKLADEKGYFLDVKGVRPILKKDDLEKFTRFKLKRYRKT